MMTRRCASCERISERISIPLRPGRARSSSTRSKGRSPTRCSPSSPVTAVSTSKFSSSSKVCRDSRISASSSMMSTDPTGSVFPCSVPRDMTAASDIDCLPAQGKIQCECSSGTGMTFHANLAGVFLNDAVGHRQTQASSAVLSLARSGFGGEERIVNALNMFRSDARTSVGDADGNQGAIGGCNTQGSAAGHGVFGIQEQVQEYLLQSTRVTLNRRNGRSEFVMHLNLCRLELVLQQRERIGDDLVDVDVGELGAAGARKIEQVVDDLGSAEGLPSDLLQQARLLRIALQL